MSASDYLQAFLVLRMNDNSFVELFDTEWHTRDAAYELLSRYFDDACKSLGVTPPPESRAKDAIVETVLESQAFDVRGNEFTGVWCKVDYSKRNSMVAYYQTQDEAGSLLHQLGQGAILNALRKSAEELGWAIDQADANGFEESGTVNEYAVPASDRIVKLDDNQITETDEQVGELLDALEADNGVPDEPGVRERLMGQLKAGRELIRAGEFRAYLLYEVLVKALNEILEKYGNETIKALANALLGAVVAKILEG